MRRAPLIEVLLLSLSLVACSRPPPKRIPVAVRVETVAASHAGATARYSGTTHADKQVELAFRLGGYIQTIGRADGRAKGRHIQAGDRVARDVVLASLRQSDFKHKFSELSGMSSEAAAGLHKAKADYERARTLLGEGAISQAEFDATKARFDGLSGGAAAAVARTSQAGLALSDTQLRAPFDGVVLERRVEVGALVAPGAPAFLVADTSTIKVVFGVPDSVQRELALGAEVTVTTDAFPDQSFTGTITKVAAQADAKTRVFDVEASIDNRQGLLKVGMVTTIQLGKSGQAAPVLLVPLSAVVRLSAKDKGFWVFVASDGPQGTTVQARSVELGALVGNRVSVTQGLAAGERVVVQGATLVTDGQPVSVVPAVTGTGTSS